MKIILSRKGFDGSNGGMPSPIMPPDRTTGNRRLLTMPIPNNDKDTYSDLKYGEKSYYEILSNLKKNLKIGPNCHIDPDIDRDRRIKPIKDWQPAFGQSHNAQSYLKKNVGIQEGDIFLFFGNFRAVELDESNNYRYIRKHENAYLCREIQAIWGYFQVGKIIEDIDEIKKYYWHPHASEPILSGRMNTLYIPTDKLSLDPQKNGCGSLPFHEKRVLTRPGEPGRKWRKATWKENPVYALDAIVTPPVRKNSSPDEGIYYQGIWQEMGLKECDAAIQWAIDMITA